VTCPSSPADTSASAPTRGEPTTTTASERALTRLNRDDALTQLLRFALAGGTSTLLYALIFLTLHRLGYLPAHVTATIISSIFVNELHRRLTFHAGQRVSFLSAQWEAGTVSLIGLAATSAALGWLDETTTNAPAALQIALVVLVTTVIGAMRFIALRWLFRPQDRPRD
jgi:putative flippase GtrA